MKLFLPSLFVLVLTAALPAADNIPGDPFAPYLDGKPPEILREAKATKTPPEGVKLQRVVFRLRDDAEVLAVIASPTAPGPHPGLLVLHGGGGSAEQDRAVAWAQQGYIAVAPDLPGIAEPKKLVETKGRWTAMKYGEGRYVAAPDVKASVIFDAALAAMKSFYLLQAQPGIELDHIGVVGISWGGYMTTMVCGMAGDKVRAGFAVFGCGFYEFTSQLPALDKMPAAEREQWLKYLDAGRRAPGIKASFFTAAAANDFFFWPPAVQATLDVIPGEKNHVFAPNVTHKIPLPGGLEVETPYFDYYLRSRGEPFPKVTVEKSTNPQAARFSIKAPHPLTKVEVWWSVLGEGWMKRKWMPLTATANESEVYEVKLPADAASGADWFVVASDDRPVSVSGDLIHIASPSQAK